MKLAVLVVLSFAISLASSIAKAGDYVLTILTDENAHYIDTTTIKHRNEDVTFWVTVFYFKTTTFTSSPEDYFVVKEEVDCMDDKYRYLSGIFYNAEGSPGPSEDIVTVWKSIVPESRGKNEEKIVCNTNYVPKNHVVLNAENLLRVVRSLHDKDKIKPNP